MIIDGKSYEINFNKKYGQNFIFDRNLLSAIATDASVSSTDEVVEIGAGAGTLTIALAEKAAHVTAFEIDTALEPVLRSRLASYENVTLVFEDFMKKTVELPDHFKVVANLPYYITTPLIMRLIEGVERAESICVMVQKEVAERLTAEKGSEDYGSITASLNLEAKAKITRIVGRQNFIPQPNVDSAVVLIEREDKGYTASEIAAARSLIKSAFAMRRKTLVNNLAGVCGGKDKANELVVACGFKPTVRGEELSADDYVQLARKLGK